MQDSVFEPSFGNKPAYLVGRNDCLKIFRGALESRPGSRERALLILGQRGFGKTVLLLEMADIAHEMGYVVASPTVVSGNLLERILEKIGADGAVILDKDIPHITGGSISIMGFGGGIQTQTKESGTHSFAYNLTELCNKINAKGRGVLILVDEVQANSEELKQLIIAYQEIVGQGGNIAIAMAGLPGAVSSTLNDHVLTFLNRARKINLGPLNTKDIYAFYKEAFLKASISVPDAMSREAAEMTYGSPYLMQLNGHYMVTYCGEDGKITDDQFRQAILDGKDDYENDIAKTTLNALSDKDIEFLCAMIPDKGASKISDIADRMGKSNAYVQLYKRRLIDSGVIEQPRRGEVQIVVSYVKDYLAKHHET